MKKESSNWIYITALVLTIVLISLKLDGHINWSWLWVLSPIWMLAVLFIFFLIIGVILVKQMQKRKAAIQKIMQETGLSEHYATLKYNESQTAKKTK